MRLFFVALLGALATLSCASNAPSPTPLVGGAAAPSGAHEVIVPRTCAARTKLASLLGRNVGPGPRGTAPIARAPTPPGPPQPVSPALDAYRSGAPATVIVLAPGAMGSGVIVDPRGYVLTSWHLVAGGRKTDLVDTVSVMLGELSPTGRMVKVDRRHDAVVVKRDPVRDLALLQIKDPPPNLAAVRLAAAPPRAGDKVTAIGNTSLGFLWASKSCSVGTIGDPQSDASPTTSVDCAAVGANQDPAAAARARSQCEDGKKRAADALLRAAQGVTIQTDCPLTAGDSGGPLLASNGELVGLNESPRVDGQRNAFHLHVDELRDFVSSFPTTSAAIVPDPYCDGGADPSLEDLDFDGTPESLAAKDSSPGGTVTRLSLLVDLDQDDTAQKGRRSARPDGDPFDAEVAFVASPDGIFVWYDTDNDGRFDVLLHDKNGDGVPDKGYRLDAAGTPKEDPAIALTHDFTEQLVRSRDQQLRLGKVVHTIGSDHLASPFLRGGTKVAPTDMFTGTGIHGRFYDADGDGVSDVVWMQGIFTRAALIDADQNSLESHKPGTVADDVVKRREVDPEVTVVVGPMGAWALYDLDNDGRPDLSLETTIVSDLNALFATRAMHLPERSPAREYLGRRLLQPTLLPTLPRLGAAFRLLRTESATNEGLGSLPSVMPTKADVIVVATAGVPEGTVALASSGAWSTTFLDLDRPRTKKPVSSEDIGRALGQGTHDAEIAIVQRTVNEEVLTWAFYDTDNDGKFDWILYAQSGHDVTQAYRVRNGALEVDTAAHGKVIRTNGVFRNRALGAKWQSLARTLYKPGMFDE